MVKLGTNPELILERQQKDTKEGHTRQYTARAALKQYYAEKAARVGLSLEAYCTRFGVNLKQE